MLFLDGQELKDYGLIMRIKIQPTAKIIMKMKVI